MRKEIHAEDVTSLYTADNIVGRDGDLDVEPFYEKVPQSERAKAQLREAVRSNEMVYRRLVSEDESTALIVARIDDDVFSQEFYRDVLDLSKRYEGPEKVYVAGRPIVEGTMALLGPADMKRMVPVVILVITLVLLLVLRSVTASIAVLLVVVFSTIWTFGLMAFFKVPVYAVSTMIPVMLIAIGVADGIHLYNHLKHGMKLYPGAGKEKAIQYMITEMWKPVVMTSITTAVGFLSLLTSSVYPIKYFGLFTAFGVMAAMVCHLPSFSRYSHYLHYAIPVKSRYLKADK